MAAHLTSVLLWITLLLPTLVVSAATTTPSPAVTQIKRLYLENAVLYQYSKVTTRHPVNWQQARQACNHNSMDLFSQEMVMHEDALWQEMTRSGGVHSTFLGLTLRHSCQKKMTDTYGYTRTTTDNCNAAGHYLCPGQNSCRSTPLYGTWYQAYHQCKQQQQQQQQHQYWYAPTSTPTTTCPPLYNYHLWNVDVQPTYRWKQCLYGDFMCGSALNGSRAANIEMRTGEASRAYVVLDSDGTMYTTSLQDVKLTSFVCQKSAFSSSFDDSSWEDELSGVPTPRPTVYSANRYDTKKTTTKHHTYNGYHYSDSSYSSYSSSSSSSGHSAAVGAGTGGLVVLVVLFVGLRFCLIARRVQRASQPRVVTVRGVRVVRCPQTGVQRPPGSPPPYTPPTAGGVARAHEGLPTDPAPPYTPAAGASGVNVPGGASNIHVPGGDVKPTGAAIQGSATLDQEVPPPNNSSDKAGLVMNDYTSNHSHV